MDTIFKTISFKNLSNWSVSHLLANDFNYNKEFPLVRIGNFLTRNKTRIEIDDNTIYKRVTIRLYNKGVKLRNTEIGKKIGTKKQFLIKKGQFLLSKIDARNGAFGIATDEVDGAIITADFFAYDIDETQIDPLFLVLITTTEQFLKFAQSASSGTTGRQRIDETKFLNVKIPLPTLEKQKRILDRYKKRKKKVLEIKNNIQDLEKSIEDYLHSSLSIERDKNRKEQSVLSFLRFKDLKRWDIDYNLNKNNNSFTSKYEIKTINSITNDIFQGVSRKRTDKKTNILIKVKNIGVDNINYESIEYIDIVPERKKLIYGDIITPFIGEAIKLKKFSIFKPIDKDVVTDNNVGVIRVDKNIINPFFLILLMPQDFVFNQISNLIGGSSVPYIGSNNIKKIKIPLPPINVQNEIVDYIKLKKEKIQKLKSEEIVNNQKAIKEFVKEIFNEAN